MNVVGTVILPIAGRSSRFPGMRPKWMLSAPSGRLMLELSLSTIENWRNHRVVIGGLSEHLQDLHGETAIRRALGSDPEIINFDKPTDGPASTVAEILNRANITGPIFIKDCDSWFTPDGDVFDNVVCVADLRTLKDVRNVAEKSFLGINSEGIVTNIVEKSVFSNHISVGGYGFHSASDFKASYEKLKGEESGNEKFVSDVILQMIRNGAAFRAVDTKYYRDVGTLPAWNSFRARQATYFVDLDGVVFKNAGQYTPPFWDDVDVPIAENVATLLSLVQEGAQLIFVTARPEAYRIKTESALTNLGLSWHSIIFGLNHSTRVLINDFAASNPHPSAVAVNVPRNGTDLSSYLSSRS